MADYVDGLKVPELAKDEAWGTNDTGRPGGILQDQFWEFHHLGELQTPKSRMTAIGLTYLAFVFMGWVILQNLFEVAKYALLHQALK